MSASTSISSINVKPSCTRRAGPALLVWVSVMERCCGSRHQQSIDRVGQLGKPSLKDPQAQGANRSDGQKYFSNGIIAHHQGVGVRCLLNGETCFDDGFDEARLDFRPDIALETVHYQRFLADRSIP